MKPVRKMTRTKRKSALLYSVMVLLNKFIGILLGYITTKIDLGYRVGDIIYVHVQNQNTQSSCCCRYSTTQRASTDAGDEHRTVFVSQQNKQELIRR